jgi:hypothetical protein
MSVLKQDKLSNVGTGTSGQPGTLARHQLSANRKKGRDVPQTGDSTKTESRPTNRGHHVLQTGDSSVPKTGNSFGSKCSADPGHRDNTDCPANREHSSLVSALVKDALLQIRRRE